MAKDMRCVPQIALQIKHLRKCPAFLARQDISTSA